MKKRVVAACLAAVLGIAPCSVSASQESEVQCISETESSDILLETCTQEFQETKPEVSEETLPRKLKQLSRKHNLSQRQQ